MLSVFLKSKLHRITVTEAELDYQGSITLDEDFMDVVGIRAFEKVLVANLANGERFETYALPGSRGSRVCCLNGATARKGAPGDKVIVFAFCLLEDAEISEHKPKIVIFGENNEIIRKSME